MISSQAFPSSMGAAVKPMNGCKRGQWTIKRPQVQLFNQIIADASANLSALELGQMLNSPMKYDIFLKPKKFEMSKISKDIK